MITGRYLIVTYDYLWSFGVVVPLDFDATEVKRLAAYGETMSVEFKRSTKTKPLSDRDLIEAANGQPMLVAYWFKHDANRIRQRFPQARELKTSTDIADWNKRRIPLALIHPASAGHGLNLQAGGAACWSGSR